MVMDGSCGENQFGGPVSSGAPQRGSRDFSALVSAGAGLKLVNGVTLLGKFDGELARSSSTYAGGGTIRYSW
jgi:hypothetical protein